MRRSAPGDRGIPLCLSSPPARQLETAREFPSHGPGPRACPSHRPTLVTAAVRVTLDIVRVAFGRIWRPAGLATSAHVSLGLRRRLGDGEMRLKSPVLLYSPSLLFSLSPLSPSLSPFPPSLPPSPSLSLPLPLSLSFSLPLSPPLSRSRSPSRSRALSVPSPLLSAPFLFHIHNQLKTSLLGKVLK